MDKDLDQLLQDCERAADFYAEKPGYVQPATTIDLYRTIAKLARLIRKHQIDIEAIERRTL